MAPAPTKIRKKLETNFRQNSVIPFLKTLQNTMAFPIQQVSIRGDPDYILCVAGRFVSLELKSEGGDLAALQKYKKYQIEKCGGVGFVANPQTWAAVKAALLQLDQGE